nr:MAG TPA: hypothetical protein [Caudoviricetes sp.]
MVVAVKQFVQNPYRVGHPPPCRTSRIPKKWRTIIPKAWMWLSKPIPPAGC